MSSGEYVSDSTGSSQHSGATGRLEAEIDRMNISSSAPEAGAGKGQEASSSNQAITRGAWKGSDVKQPEIDWLYRSRRIPAETCERFPRITAEALQGPIRKRALDEEDPDPHAAGHKHKMGRTHTSRPDLPSASGNPPIVEHATPLEAMVGQEFLDKLATRGQKKKAPAPEAGTSDAPPPKRSRTETVAGKVVTSKRYRKREMPVSSGPPLKIAKSATGMRPESTEDHRAEEDFSSPPEVQGTGASNIGAGTEDAGRAEPLVPPVPEKTTTSTASPSKSVSDPSAPASSSVAKDAPEAPAPPPAAPTGTPAAGRPTTPAPDPAAVASAASSPSSSSRSLVLHASRAAHVAGETASAQLGRITELTRGGADLGHLADYAEKWNRADLSPSTLGLGKDSLPVVDPAGPRSTGQHFGRLRRAVKEFDTAWHDANHSVADLSDQLATLKAEKEQLAKEHQEALDAQRKVTAELKDKLMESEVRHSQELKDAQAAAETKLDDTLKEFTHNSKVLRLELEEESKARKAAEERIATLTTDQAAYDQLVMQADALASKLFPDSQVHASKKVAEHRAKQSMTNPDAPWDSYDHLVALAARICHMRAVDRHLVELPERAIEIFKVLWHEEAVPVNLTLISDRYAGVYDVR
nr:actin cytoskeleton-regulatory complex protein PAN1-like [Lolium perenne]